MLFDPLELLTEEFPKLLPFPPLTEPISATSEKIGSRTLVRGLPGGVPVLSGEWSGLVGGPILGEATGSTGSGPRSLQPSLEGPIIESG